MGINRAFVVVCSIGIILGSALGAQAEGGYPTPFSIHERLDEVRAEQIRRQVENIKEALNENMEFMPGTRLLRSSCNLLKTNYDTSAILEVRRGFLEAGWGCDYQDSGAYIKFTIWESN